MEILHVNYAVRKRNYGNLSLSIIGCSKNMEMWIIAFVSEKMTLVAEKL